MKRKEKRGLINGRIAWNMDENIICSYLAERGFHAHKIASLTGMTEGQVYNRCRLLGAKLRDYRNGETPAAKVILSNIRVKKMTTKEVNKLKRECSISSL